MARLSFLGAAKTVTGSEYLIEAGDARVLVDCGMFQGEKALRLRNWADPPFDPSTVQDLILTHTHLDHIGRIPRLAKLGFKGRIWCTPPTLDLAQILLLDSAHLQEEDAAYLNRKGLSKHKPALPLYDQDDVRECLKLFRAAAVGEEHETAGGTRFRYRNAGHLLGAASVELVVPTDSKGELRVLLSGDVGRFEAVLTKAPDLARGADFVVIESTYGNRSHSELPAVEQLEAVLKRTFARGGVLLIPAFAVGRAQQLLVLMDDLVTRGRVRPFPVHVDSPMAVDATRIYERYPEENHLALGSIGTRSLVHRNNVHLHKSRQESEALNELRGPAVIISSSGMLSGGRILHHCRVRLPHPENTLLITGYQAATTLGRALLDGAHTVRIHKTEVPVLAEVASLKGMSGHADGKELLRWLSGVDTAPRMVFCTHGEEDAALALAARITSERGFPTHVPAMFESWDLASAKRAS